jgi:predicted amidophosphoribosyltransferase
MSISCVDCANCGKCYEKNSVCLVCGGIIYLLDEACPHCGEPITDAMREMAQEAYKRYKWELRESLFPGLARNREKRARFLKKAVGQPSGQDHS